VNVTVPVNTDASGDTVYLAGNLSALGLGQSDWAANGIPMTRVSADKWTATVDAAASTTLSYKYDLGGTWTLTITGVPVAAFSYKFTVGSRNNVEESSGCGYVSNRTSGFNTANVTYTANDTVAAWPGVGGC
jgi:hypothetical protein